MSRWSVSCDLQMWITNGCRRSTGTTQNSWRQSQNDKPDPPSSLGQNRPPPYHNWARTSLGYHAPRQRLRKKKWEKNLTSRLKSTFWGIYSLPFPQERVPILSAGRIYGFLKIDFAKQSCGQMLTCSLADISSSGPARLKQVLFSSCESREQRNKGEIQFSSISGGAPSWARAGLTLTMPKFCARVHSGFSLKNGIMQLQIQDRRISQGPAQAQSAEKFFPTWVCQEPDSRMILVGRAA